MTAKQQSSLEHIRQMSRDFADTTADYRNQYSNESTWQFWLCLALLILPLIWLFKYLDRSRAFYIGFFGFAVHVSFLYIDSFGSHGGLWIYPYKVFPFLPMSLVLDCSLVPVSFMMVYQWTLNRSRNSYLFLTILCAVYAFVLKPLMSWAELFWLFEWMNFFYLFIGYLIVMLFSLGITRLFSYLQAHAGERAG